MKPWAPQPVHTHVLRAMAEARGLGCISRTRVLSKDVTLLV